MLARFAEKFQAMKVLLILALFLTSCVAQTKPQVTENTPVNVGDKTYAEQIKTVQNVRESLAKEYRQNSDKKAVIEKARKSFVSSIYNNIIPDWYGTDWDFYGTTETPKQGKIACGYFVSTVLRDAGAKVQRVSMAQQASENIIKSLTTTQFIKRFHNAQIEDFVADIEKQGEGIYVVGLDNHVGFILHDGENVWFIHASYGEPSEVIKEKAIESIILSGSKYRVTGKISADDNFIVKWLNQTPIATVRR
jgi:hypothetical protein